MQVTRSLGNEIELVLSKDKDGPDTKVTIQEPIGASVCWISWEDREKFIEELNDVVTKYRI